MGSILGTFHGKCCDSNVFNNNDMHLGREVFETLIASDEYKRAMKNRHYLGFLGHPDNPDCQDYEHGCIVMTDMQIADDGEIEGDFDLIDTPVGRVVKAFIDAGVKFGISIRGFGDVAPDGEVDPDQFIFRGFDLVTFPAYDDCIPKFREIAASTDLNKKAKYKKICASIDANLKNINSCEALKVIQEQLPDGSEEFNKVQDRIDELCGNDDECNVMQQKLDAVTELYLDAAEKVRQLESALANVNCENQSLMIECTTLRHNKTRLNRIYANQIETANAACNRLDSEVRRSNMKLVRANKQLEATRRNLEDTETAYMKEVEANTRLKDKLSSISEKRKDDQDAIKASNDLNLKYQRKIEANSEAISQKDSAIEELKTKLNETVIKCSKLESKASNLDDKNGELLSRVEAAEEMVLTYQQAYANIYANALGVHLKGLPVTASTTVEELKQMINAGTSTANIPAAPSYYEADDEDDIIDEQDEFDDDANYSADLVTI